MQNVTNNPTPTLDDLDTELEQILECLESEDPEQKAAAEELFVKILPVLNKKIDAYAGIIQRKKASRDLRRAEAKRLNSLADRDDATVRWLTDKLAAFMERRKETLGERGKKLEGLFYKVSLANNGGKQPVWINDEISVNELPEDYVEVIPNTSKLKEDALTSGEIFDNKGRLIAKVMPRGTHIRIG